MAVLRLFPVENMHNNTLGGCVSIYTMFWQSSKGTGMESVFIAGQSRREANKLQQRPMNIAISV